MTSQFLGAASVGLALEVQCGVQLGLQAAKQTVRCLGAFRVREAKKE